jgi:thiol:disulfide interchange protein DsbC
MNTAPIIRGFFAALATLTAVPAVLAAEADIKKSIETLFPRAKVDEVRKSGVLGLYEVRIGHDVLYTDEKGSYVILGDIFDAKARRNLTEERKLKLAQIKFSDLPLDQAVKTVRGNGTRVFATFEDPNCGYCKKLAKEMAGLTDITMYTFLYPILAPDSTDKAKAIWCAPDRAKAWNEWMVAGTVPKAASCDHPIDKNVALGQKLGVSGTPTIFFADGNRIPSYIPAAKLEEVLNHSGAVQ